MSGNNHESVQTLVFESPEMADAFKAYAERSAGMIARGYIVGRGTVRVFTEGRTAVLACTQTGAAEIVAALTATATNHYHATPPE